MMSREISSRIEEAVYRGLREAGVELAGDVMQALQTAVEQEDPAASGAVVLKRILENLDTAKRTRLPMCQDTGMVMAFIDIGEDLCLPIGRIKMAVEKGAERAYEDGSFRKSVVAEPVFERVNTGNNLPLISYIESVPGNTISIHLLMKGFGSENCSGLAMLNPTTGAAGVEEAILSIIKKAGGKPCPPIVVGVGIGGTSDRAALLSKRALLREIGSSNPDERYAELERSVLEKVQGIGIGSGGLGGKITALGLMIEEEATHIAGLPVAVSINCWADRKVHIEIDSEGNTI